MLKALISELKSAPMVRIKIKVDFRFVVDFQSLFQIVSFDEKLENMFNKLKAIISREATNSEIILATRIVNMDIM